MMEFGSAGGLLTDLREALDSSKWEEKTQQYKADMSQKLHQVNAATVGAYNNAVKERALERKAYEEDKPEEIGGLNNARKEELLERIKEKKREEFKERAMEFDENGNPTEVNNAEMVKEYQAEMEKLQQQYDNGELTDEQLIEQAGGKDASWYITDTANMIGDGLKEGISAATSALQTAAGVVKEAFDGIKGEMCNNSPFRECVGCSNRPRIGHVKYNPMFGLGNILSTLKSGLTDGLEAVLDCPGMTTSLVTGDFSKVGGALATAALTKTTKLAASMGQAVLCKGLAAAAGPLANAGSWVGNLVGNIPGSESALGATSSIMEKAGITGDMLFTGAMQVAGRTLAGTEVAGAGLIGGIIAGDTRLAVESTLLDVRENVPKLDKMIRTNKTRTRYGLTAYDIKSLHGAGSSTREYRTSFAIDLIHNNYRTPRDTNVRPHKSAADALM